MSEADQVPESEVANPEILALRRVPGLSYGEAEALIGFLAQIRADGGQPLAVPRKRYTQAKFFTREALQQQSERWAKLRAEGHNTSEIAQIDAVAKQTVSRALRKRDEAIGARTYSDTAREAAIIAWDRLELIIGEAFKIASNPPPKTSATGKVVLDMEGRAVPDVSLTVAALGEARKAIADERTLLGLDRPGKSIHATVSLDSEIRQSAAGLAELLGTPVTGPGGGQEARQAIEGPGAVRGQAES